MTKEELIRKIDKTIEGNKMVTVYYKAADRSPQYGKFVKLPDNEEMLKKGFIRFVINHRIELFDGLQHEMYTRLVSIDNVFDIKM